MVWFSLLLVLLLGLEKVYTDSTGDQVPAGSQRECCIENNIGKNRSSE